MKDLIKKIVFTIVIFALSNFTNLFAQVSEKYNSKYAAFFSAEELYEKEQFAAAKKKFKDFYVKLNQPTDPFYIKALYYEGLSALELYNNDAIGLLQEFNNKYPENIYKNNIYFKFGQHFYQTKKYEEALEWFEKTDKNDLDTSLLDEYSFKLGYAYFQLENYPEARNAFYDVKDSKGAYGGPALYYYAHIAYKNKTYQTALDAFLKLKENPTFKNEVAYYIIQIYYLLGDFDALLTFAPGSIDEGANSKTPEMNQLIGDAYFRVERYDEAIVYLEDYAKSTQTTREDKYQLGYAYYKSTYYNKAIQLFDRVAGNYNDKLAQVALYHAAESYKKIDRLDYARSAFEKAANIDADLKIKEDALYHYAVLSYELDYNPYNESIKAFEKFLNEFPNSTRKEDVNTYLVNVYANTKKYKEALASLDRINDKSLRLKTTYQIIAFNWGVELYERGDFLDAINKFDLVEKYPVDNRLIGKAYFWQADAYFQLEHYDKAIPKYRSFQQTPGNIENNLKQLSYYNIAYAYYYLEDYTQAIEAFRTFTKLPNNEDKLRLADAFTRVGDSYFTKENPDFDKAVINYQQAIDLRQRSVDRSLFYLGQTYSFIPNKENEKISTLLDIVNNYRNSQYLVPAVFEIGLTYKYQANYEKSLQYLNQIVNDFPKNILVQDAIIEIADVKYKQKNYKEAESYFKRVLNEYNLNDEKCKTATQGLQDIYRATRQQEKIIDLAKLYPCSDISEDDQEAFFYEAAAELYLNENYQEAIPELKKYLTTYPEGRFSTQLLSYLADIYYISDDKGQAMPLYERILERPNSPYTEEALVRTSKTYYNDGEYEKALPYYTRLTQLSSTPQVIFNSRVGVMRCNYLLELYLNAAESAQVVLGDQLLNNDAQIEANYIAGMSFYYHESFDRAIPYLEWTAENTGAERGTEALHTLAEIYFEKANFEKAEAIHKQLMQRKPAYDFWIGKSLLLQTKVFVAIDDLFQAEFTVNLIIENYPNNDDGIKLDAEKLKSEILQLKGIDAPTRKSQGNVINIEEGN